MHGTYDQVYIESYLDMIDAAASDGRSCIGDPEEVTRAVERFAGTGADQLVFGMLSTTMPIDAAIEAVETFGEHVIPQFDKDPMHSTARQREEQRAAVPA